MLKAHAIFSKVERLGENTLIGPFFIDENLNAAKYEDMLRNKIFPAIRRIVFAHIWFQQDDRIIIEVCKIS